jgi:SAM-dependent methyltransferase
MSLPYDPAFFDTVREGARASAERIVPVVLELTGARSVVDVGCGDGTWLSVFARHGIADYLGVDGSYVDTNRLAIPRERFEPRDLEQPFSIARTFDVAVSLEVGEHLYDASADGFVASLAKLAPCLVFSAAIPHQTGAHHVNEQWPEYWARKFKQVGFVAIDAVRSRVWDDENVAWWYAQNTIVFVREGAMGSYPALACAFAATDPLHLTRIHPRNYERLGPLLAEKERRHNRLSRRIGRLLRGRRPD